jgi:peptidoglycan/xylan/chitin deacetylase (PgdA/CDA1 family)
VTGEAIPRHAPQTFESFIAWLVQRANVLPLANLTTTDANTGNRRPSVALTFDDGTIDNYTVALPILTKYGCTATFFVVTSMVGRGDGLTASMLREMVAQGMTIGSHSVSHPHLTSISTSQIWSEVSDSRERLSQMTGADCTEFSYPYGDYNKPIKEMVRRAGYHRAVTASEMKVPTDAFEMPRTTIFDLTWSPLFQISLYGARSWRRDLRPDAN